MKIQLIYKDITDDSKQTIPHQPVGWEIIPETSEDDITIGTMRDLQFFGFDNTHIEYDGLTLKDPEKGKVMGNVAKLSYIQGKFQDK